MKAKLIIKELKGDRVYIKCTCGAETDTAKALLDKCPVCGKKFK